jgi:cytochrome b561
VLIATAIALVATGASSASKVTSSDPDALSKNQTLVKVGEVLLLLAWLAIAVLALFTAARTYHGRTKRRDAVSSGRTLLYAVVLAIPFLGIRLLTGLVYFFTGDPVLNPVAGSVGLRVGLEVVEEIIITLVYVVAGFTTRNISKGAEHEAS